MTQLVCICSNPPDYSDEMFINPSRPNTHGHLALLMFWMFRNHIDMLFPVRPAHVQQVELQAKVQSRACILS